MDKNFQKFANDYAKVEQMERIKHITRSDYYYFCMKYIELMRLLCKIGKFQSTDMSLRQIQNT